MASRKGVGGRRKNEVNQYKERIKPKIKLTDEREKLMTQTSAVAMKHSAGCCKTDLHQLMKETVV